MLVHDHKYNLNLHYLTLQWRIGMFTASSSFCICSYVVENYQLMTVLYIKKYLWQNICVFDNVLNSVLNINILLCTIVSGMNRNRIQHLNIYLSPSSLSKVDRCMSQKQIISSLFGADIEITTHNSNHTIFHIDEHCPYLFITTPYQSSSNFLTVTLSKSIYLCKNSK